MTRDHLWAIGALTAEGKLVMQIQDHAYKGPDVVRFLRLLLRKLAGNLLVMWDGTPIHRSQVVKEFLSKGEPNVSIWNVCLAMRQNSTHKMCNQS